MEATSSQKPRYLGLLNAISLAESHAGIYLEAWANATCDEDLACTLRLVAAREKSHGDVFCRRLSELGYSLRHKPDPEAEGRIACYGNPKMSDLEKIATRREDGDPFGEIEQRLRAGEFDPMTANLLGWYICEERDSGRRLREAYDCVRAKANGGMQNGKANGHAETTNGSGLSADAKAILACVTEGFAKLEKRLASLPVH